MIIQLLQECHPPSVQFLFNRTGCSMCLRLPRSPPCWDSFIRRSTCLMPIFWFLWRPPQRWHGSGSSPLYCLNSVFVSAMKLGIFEDTWGPELIWSSLDSLLWYLNYALFFWTVALASDPESRIIMLGLHRDLCFFYILFFFDPQIRLNSFFGLNLFQPCLGR